MTAATKKKISIGTISVLLGLIVAAITFIGKVDAIAKDKFIIPVVDERIDCKTKFSNEKLDVLYQYTMEKAIKDGSQDLWNKCVDKVQNTNKIGKIGRGVQ